MGFTNAEQLREVFAACGLGFLLSVLYDGFYLVRRYLKPPAVVVFLLDIVYFALAAVVLFLFCLVMTQGEVRFFSVFAAFLGFVAYRLTIGRMTSRLTDRFLGFFERIGNACERSLDRMICRSKGYLNTVKRKLMETVEKIRKKAKKFSKKGCNKVVK